jgi:hypothetical protein
LTSVNRLLKKGCQGIPVEEPFSKGSIKTRTKAMQKTVLILAVAAAVTTSLLSKVFANREHRNA